MSGSLHVVGTRALVNALGVYHCNCPSSLVGVETLLASKPGRVFSIPEIADWLYAELDDGGANAASEVVYFAVSRLRRRGVPIRTHGHRGYSLVRAA